MPEKKTKHAGQPYDPICRLPFGLQETQKMEIKKEPNFLQDTEWKYKNN